MYGLRMHRCGQCNSHLECTVKLEEIYHVTRPVSVEDQQQNVLEATAWDIKFTCFLEL